MIAKISEELLGFVNPLQGTDSREDFSRGNTLPLVCTPFPMTAWTMQTDTGRWAFRWTDAKLQGIRATHQPSPWMADHGQFTVQPQTGDLLLKAFDRSSSYDRHTMVVRPDYLAVDLLRYECRMEITPSPRGLKLRLRFPATSAGTTARLVVDCFAQGGTLAWDAARKIVTGSSSANDGGVPPNFAQWFAIRLSVPVTAFHGGGQAPFSLVTSHPEPLLGAAEFIIPTGGIVECDIATSYIGIDQALLNLDREIGTSSFEAVRARTAAQWEERLSAATITTEDLKQKRTFYSCFYRTLTFPHQMHETDAAGKTVHFSPYNGKVEPGLLFAGHGFWDTYRTAYPLYALLFPADYRDFLEGWINAYKEGGWFPRWPSPGYRTCMLSTHVDAVFADAIAKGIDGFDFATAYAGLRKHAFEEPVEDLGFGRPGIRQYLSLDYIPADQFRHSVAATLDSAYCDYCLSLVAEHLGHTEDAAVFRRRAQNYRNVYDPAVGFMRGKNADGSWLEPFREFYWGGPYVEGGPWQTSWGVPHDPAGLIALNGGAKPFVQKLEKMLAIPAHFEIGDYGFEIHEMSEMAVAPFGQYAHSNQPVHHVLYLFNEAGAPELTDHWVGRILREYYHDGPGGFPGDEDNGEMSAWYVLSALGLFPLCPGNPDYTLTVPLFQQATVRLPGGTLEIVAPPGTGGQFSFNGKKIDGRKISHTAIANGGRLEYGTAPGQSPRKIEAPLATSAV